MACHQTYLKLRNFFWLHLTLYIELPNSIFLALSSSVNIISSDGSIYLSNFLDVLLLSFSAIPWLKGKVSHETCIIEKFFLIASYFIHWIAEQYLSCTKLQCKYHFQWWIYLPFKFSWCFTFILLCNPLTKRKSLPWNMHNNMIAAL